MSCFFSNVQVIHMPMASPDVVVDLDSGLVVRTPMAAAVAAAPGERGKFLDLQQRRVAAAFDDLGSGLGSGFGGGGLVGDGGAFAPLLAAVDALRPAYRAKAERAVVQAGGGSLAAHLLVAARLGTQSALDARGGESSEEDDEVGGGGSGEGDTWVGSDAWLHREVQAIFERVLEAADEGLAAEAEDQDHAAAASPPSAGAGAVAASAGEHAAAPVGEHAAAASSGRARSSAKPSLWAPMGGLDLGAFGGGWGGRLAAAAVGAADRAGFRTDHLVRKGVPLALAPLAGYSFALLWQRSKNFALFREGHRERAARRRRAAAGGGGGGGVVNDASAMVLTKESAVGGSSGFLGDATTLLSSLAVTAGDLSFFGGGGCLPPRDGSGLFVYPSGDQYRGTFSDGMRHGRGVCVGKDGKFDGEWANDLPHGDGIFTSSTGASLGPRGFPPDRPLSFSFFFCFFFLKIGA
jgi:hypothetical protein